MLENVTLIISIASLFGFAAYHLAIAGVEIAKGNQLNNRIDRNRRDRK